MQNNFIWTDKDNKNLEKFIKENPPRRIDRSRDDKAASRIVDTPPFIKNIESEFKESLEDIAVAKINELYSDQKQFTKKVKNTAPINKLHKMVLEYSFKNYEENHKKWLKYWLRLSGYQFEANATNDATVQQAREHPIQELLSEAKRCGNKFRAPCPFHDEKNASFYIYPDNSWHCFGCTAHGNNAIDFVQKLNPEKSFKETVAELNL